MGTIITLGMPRAVEKGGVGGLHLLPGARLRNPARAGHALDAGLWAQTLNADASRGEWAHYCLWILAITTRIRIHDFFISKTLWYCTVWFKCQVLPSLNSMQSHPACAEKSMALNLS